MGKAAGLVWVLVAGCTVATGDEARQPHGPSATAASSSAVSSGPGSGGSAGVTVAASSSTAGSTAASSSTATTGAGGAPPMCLAPADCPGTDTACASRTCSMGECGQLFTPSGKAAGMQVAGDCKEAQCDGKGAPVSVFAMADTKSDGNTCTTDTCTANGPASTPWGDEKCHGVCVLPPGVVAKDGNGDPVGFYPAGPYAACGLDDVLAPGPMPWLWQFMGVTWEQKIGLTIYGRGCGDTNSVAVSPGFTCPKGAQCKVHFYAKNGLNKSYGEQLGTCE